MVLIKSKPESIMHENPFPTGFNGILNSFFDEAGIRSNAFKFTPSADIMENDKSFEIRMSLPGVKKEDVSISLEGDFLTVSGERSEVKNEETSKYLKREMNYGKFSRSFSVSKIDASKIEARYEDGILNITLPKAEEARKSIIRIQ